VHKTTVSVYSLRARSQPTVSTPVSWAEVTRCLDSGDPAALQFTAPQVLERLDKQGDLFSPVLTMHQQLPQLSEIDARLRKRKTVASAARPEATKNARIPRSRRSA